MKKLFLLALALCLCSVGLVTMFSYTTDEEAYGETKDPHEHTGSATLCWNKRNTCDGDPPVALHAQ